MGQVHRQLYHVVQRRVVVMVLCQLQNKRSLDALGLDQQRFQRTTRHIHLGMIQRMKLLQMLNVLCV